jgi:hypothetical protein
MCTQWSTPFLSCFACRLPEFDKGWLTKLLLSGQICSSRRKALRMARDRNLRPVISDSRLLVGILDVRHPMDIYVYICIYGAWCTYVYGTNSMRLLIPLSSANPGSRTVGYMCWNSWSTLEEHILSSALFPTAVSNTSSVFTTVTAF